MDPRWHSCCYLLVCCIFILPFTEGKSFCEERWREPRIYWGAPNNTYVMKVRASSVLNSSDITYRLHSSRDKFHLNEKTGQLTTASEINGKGGDTYNLSVTVSSGGVVMQCNFIVIAKYINNHPPKFTQDYQKTILYNHQPGSIQLKVTARDGSHERYNQQRYYFLREESTEDHGHFMKNHSILSTNEVKEWMYNELDSDGQDNQGFNKYLAIDRNSGQVSLKRQLDENVGRILAKVLAVDGGSPPMSDTANVEVKVTERPPNVTGDKITETGTTVCHSPSLIGQSNVFKIRFHRSSDGSQLQPMFTRRSQPPCANLGQLPPAMNYEIWAYGFDDKIVGPNRDELGPPVIRHDGPYSSKIVFTTLRCPDDLNWPNEAESFSLSYFCNCDEGDNCLPFDRCSQEPCLNEGICFNVCRNKHRRPCVNGLYEDYCSTVNPSDPCYYSGTFIYLSNYTYECLCQPGYYGQHCERVNKCLIDNKCLNGGVCRNISDNQTVCDCPTQYTGLYCENAALRIPRNYSTVPTPCDDNPCQNGACCIDHFKDPYCICPYGITGSFCEFVVDTPQRASTPPGICNNNPCKNGGSCIDHLFYLDCICPDGFTGYYCQYAAASTTMDSPFPAIHDNNPCKNEETCKNHLNQVDRMCPDGFIGTDCDLLIATTTAMPSTVPDPRKSNLCFCAADQIDNIKGTFNFDKTANNTWVHLPCPYGPPDVKATRRCITEHDDKIPNWGNINDSACHYLNQLESDINSFIKDLKVTDTPSKFISDSMKAKEADTQTFGSVMKMIQSYVSVKMFNETIDIMTQKFYIEVQKLSIKNKVGSD